MGAADVLRTLLDAEPLPVGSLVLALMVLVEQFRGDSERVESARRVKDAPALGHEVLDDVPARVQRLAAGVLVPVGKGIEAHVGGEKISVAAPTAGAERIAARFVKHHAGIIARMIRLW